MLNCHATKDKSKGEGSSNIFKNVEESIMVPYGWINAKLAKPINDICNINMGR
jgi:hypothetical protein